MIPSLPKFLDLNRSKRSGLRGECRAKAADLAEGARAGGREGGEGSPRVGWEV